MSMDGEGGLGGDEGGHQEEWGKYCMGRGGNRGLDGGQGETRGKGVTWSDPE